MASPCKLECCFEHLNLAGNQKMPGYQNFGGNTGRLSQVIGQGSSVHVKDEAQKFGNQVKINVGLGMKFGSGASTASTFATSQVEKVSDAVSYVDDEDDYLEELAPSSIEVQNYIPAKHSIEVEGDKKEAETLCGGKRRVRDADQIEFLRSDRLGAEPGRKRVRRDYIKWDAKLPEGQQESEEMSEAMNMLDDLSDFGDLNDLESAGLWMNLGEEAPQPLRRSNAVVLMDHRNKCLLL
jgi:hypothetical protein